MPINILVIWELLLRDPKSATSLSALPSVDADPSFFPEGIDKKSRAVGPALLECTFDASDLNVCCYEPIRQSK